MGNPGLLAGLNPGTGRDYRPRLRGFSASGSAITQPVLIDPRFSIGHFVVTTTDWVIGWGQITLQAGDTLGTGESVWGLSIPVPANRSSGGADLPIGAAFLWKGAAADPSVNLIGQVTLMDPLLPGGSQGAQDSFVQVFLSKLVGFGTTSIPSGATSVTVTHGVAETPAAYDPRVVLTNIPTNNPGWIAVQNITATTFDIVCQNNPGSGGASLAWKIEAEPNSTSEFALLMSHAKPWAWAAGGVIGFNFQYEARR